MTPNSVKVVWETTDSFTPVLKLKNKQTGEEKIYNSGINSTFHELVVSDLIPSTTYTYSIGLSTTLLFTNDEFQFTTPSDVNGAPIRMIALGDCGTGTPAQSNLIQTIRNFTGNGNINGLMLLGDNAYLYGSRGDYKSRFFDIYGKQLLPNTALWPVPGNHDYSDQTNSFPYYYSAFNLPQNGECGGLASHTERYYSYEISNVHFVALDSYGSEEGKRMSDTTSKQFHWLKADLAANSKDWTVVYFHHPPFSLGSHNSDTEKELIEIRQNLVPVFERYGVDLVLTGHSHTYERSYRINGFTGTSDNFEAKNHQTETTSGNYANECPFFQENGGVVYCVAGTAGWTGVTSTGYPHKAMTYSNAVDVGAVILDFKENRFDMKYLLENGSITDQFTMFKNVNQKSNLEIECGEKIDLSASWEGEYVWNFRGLTNQKISVDSLIDNQLYIVRDQMNCLADTFQVTVKEFPDVNAGLDQSVLEGETLSLAGEGNVGNFALWVVPNGQIYSSRSFSIPDVTTDNAGWYVFQNYYKSCFSEDSVYVTVNPVLATEKETNFLIYPNPSSQFIKANFNLKTEGFYEITIIDVNGKNVFTKNTYLKSGLQDFIMDFGPVSSGTYLFKVKGSELKISRRILIE